MSPFPEVGSAVERADDGRPGMPRCKEGILSLNPLEETGWNDLVQSQPGTSFFHSSSWAEVLHDTYGHSPHYFCAMNGSRLAGALPIMEVNSLVTGRRGVALPFTDECRFVAEDPASAGEILREAMDFGRKRNWKYLEIRGPGRVVGAASPSLSFLGHELPLSGQPDQVFGRFESSVRRAIRKAEAAKIQVQISQSYESLLIYYSLHCRTRKKHGLPPQSLAFFQSIFRKVLSKGRGLIAVARHQDRPIAAAMFFHFGDRAIYKFGASDLAFQHLRGNNLVMWEAIKWYSGRGHASLNFGRTSVANDGLRRYKLGFGTAEYPIDYFKYDFRKEAFVGDRDKVVGWFNGVFRLMPTPLSRMVGRMLYRHLS